jgi:hypothetical protein
MINQLVKLITDESKWLPTAMGLALLRVTFLLYRHRHLNLPTRERVMAAMNLFFGFTIGIMAIGHLLAVTTKLATGTLAGSTPLLYAIGILLTVPCWWLVRYSRTMLACGECQGRTALVLNGWLVITLIALGLHNIPLAVPGLLNIGYHLHTRQVVGWAIVSLAVAANVGLFIGSLIFLASGQSFEEFTGMH